MRGVCLGSLLCFFILLLQKSCLCSVLYFGKITPGVRGSEMNWIDRGGFFLFSNNSNFGFGFVPTPQDVTLFLLAVVHRSSSTIIWSANRATPVQNSDMFVFNESGDSFLLKGGALIWSTGTAHQGASFMQLQDNGNLAVLKEDNTPLWQSFTQPTNTLVENQSFTNGMKLTSDSDQYNLTYSLEFNSGNLLLFSDFRTPQPYWSLQNDVRRTINNAGMVAEAVISSGSWRFLDARGGLLSQLIFSGGSDSNSTWVAVLGSDGFITFNALQNGAASMAASMKIPDGQCSVPQPCEPYFVCSGGNMCQCPSPLSSFSNCNPLIAHCSTPTQLVEIGNNDLYYFALSISPPSPPSSDLTQCISSCSSNCSCSALFFQQQTNSCFMFERLGSLQSPGNNTGFLSYVKIPTTKPITTTTPPTTTTTTSQGGSNKLAVIIIITISAATAVVIFCMLYAGYKYFIKKPHISSLDSPAGGGEGGSEEDDFFKELSGMPVRLSYKELETATEGFSVKLGQGGFGSVYRGVLRDGTPVAVKRLDSIGQGKREFRAEVSIIGSIHHMHLVRLKGYCTEGRHRLLAYEYLPKGSLDKWIFKKNEGERGGLVLNWRTRFEIAVGTAKGLAYLHEDCDAKIIHCDIKPENVLLDDKFQAKVSDFGLAKLMTREQSHVFTNMRGTRGYLAPEWLVNYAISEKCDVYSYGVLLLEMIGGRKNYVAGESVERCHLSAFAMRMVEEGRVREVVGGVEVGEGEEEEMLERAVRVGLWCVQEDTHVRPSMGKVVQMLEGRCVVPDPPFSSRIGITSFLKPFSDGGESSSTLLDFDSDRPARSLPAFSQSAVELSGPR